LISGIVQIIEKMKREMRRQEAGGMCVWTEDAIKLRRVITEAKESD